MERVLLPYINPKPANLASTVAGSKSEVETLETRANEDVSGVNSAISESDSQSNNLESNSENDHKLSGDQGSQVVASEVSFNESDIISINTNLFFCKISKKGGRIISFKLKNFNKDGANDTEMFDMVVHKRGSAYPGGLFKGDQSDINTQYAATVSNAGMQVVLSGSFPNGEKIEKTFLFNPESYLFAMSGRTIDAPRTKDPFVFQWINELSAKDAGLLDAYNVVGFVWFEGDLAQRLEFAKMVGPQANKKLSCNKWVGLGDKYFSTAITTPEAEMKDSEKSLTTECIEGTYPRASIKREKELAVMNVSLDPQSGGDQEINLKIYSGPKSYALLEKEGLELRRLVDLGKTGFIAAPLLSFLNFLNRFVNNYGLAIVLLTICVKLCLYPLNTTQYRQMKALQALKPEMDRIKDNIKDKQQQQMAMMELYKKKGVNPLGGCLPALLQMPIFIGLYSALMLAVELRHANYGLWVHDLSAPDKLMIGGIGIPVLVVLFTISIMVQQWITPTNIDPAQKKAMMIMPLIMFFMFMNFPAGLALYWLTNNLISIGQQEAIKYGDKSGKSGLGITLGVAAAVFAIAYLGSLF